MPEKAVKYHKQSGVNCAMAILKGFADRRDICPTKITQAHSWGGGNAPQGDCGALYAAKQLLEPDAIKQLEEDFLSKAGSTKCRPIRAAKKLTCSQCVMLAGQHVAKARTR